MKKYLSILSIALVFAGNARAQEALKEPWLVKALTGAAIEQVKAETSGGNITVTGADAEARIEVFVRPGNSRNKNASREAIRKTLEENYTLSVTAENHTLTAIAKPNKGFKDWNNSLSISFKITVPHKVSTHLLTSGGNISLSALSGTLDFTTSGGNLVVDHLGGHINGTTSGGNIIMTELQDDITLTTSGGNIDAKNSNGKMKLSTSGGSLLLHNLNGSINASTSGGNVEASEVEGDLAAHTSGGNIRMAALSCSLETSTSGGNITVSMKALGKYVKISNSGGHVDLEVPQGKGIDLKLYAEKVSTSGISGFTGKTEKDKVDGTLNGGGIPVTVHGGSRISFTVR